jgi:dihydrodipicolinate synthase/N-acetylneuraminate lyase
MVVPKRLEGVLPIIQTPFLDDESLDVESLQRSIDWAVELGVDGFGTGMVSEILRLTIDERRELTERLVEGVRGRAAVFTAVGAESARQAEALARQAERVGCDAVMAAPPLSSRLSIDALCDYYRRLADATSLTLIVQDASGYVGQAIPIGVYVWLLERYGAEKIVFKPEAEPIGPQLSALRDATSGEARIFEGSGGFLLVDSYRRGVAGTMPGMDLLDAVIALWNALQAGDEERIYRLSLPICGLVVLQLQAGLDGFLAIEKHLLVKRGLFRSVARRTPYSWELDRETAQEVDRLFGLLQRVVRDGR